MPSASEHQFQITAWNYLRRALPRAYVVSVESGWTHDGTRRSENMLMKRHRRGILSGQADIRVLVNGHSVDFELKVAGGSLSDHQLARRDELQRNGGFWFVCTSIEQIEAALLSINIPLSARTGAVGVAVPAVSKRREANYQRMHDPIPDMTRR